MTEIDRDRLEGETVAEKDLYGYKSQISDLESYIKERQGFPNPEVILDGETFAPFSTIVEDSDAEDITEIDQDEKVVDISRLKHNDSALGKHIWETLPQNKKRVA